MDAKSTNDTSALAWKTLVSKHTGLDVITQYCPEHPYVELLIPPDLQSIRRIVFKIDSHDQGCSDDVTNLGTYEGSNSWFDVAVTMPSGHDRTARRHLQANLHGDPNFREHTICWEYDSKSEAIRDWLCSVQPCDTVQIIPRARYFGWRNFVRAAEIEILGHTSNGSLLSQSLPSPAVADGVSPGQAYSYDFYQPLDRLRKTLGSLEFILDFETKIWFARLNLYH